MNAIPAWTLPAGLKSQGLFQWGGLIVDSNVPLHRLPRTDRSPQITFRWRSEPPPPSPPALVRRTLRQRDRTEVTIEVAGRPEDLRYRIDEVGTFVLRPGPSTVDLYPVPDADPMRAEHFLVNSILATFTGLRGELCLHASVVARDGAAVVWTGPSGAGKSTRAWRMLSDGWEFLSDDVAVIRLEGERCLVFPGARTVRLEGLGVPGSWNNRGKGELMLEGSGSPRVVGEVRLVVKEPLPGPVGPALLQASLLRCQWGWEWAGPEARRILDRSMWDLVERVSVQVEVWEDSVDPGASWRSAQRSTGTSAREG